MQLFNWFNQRKEEVELDQLTDHSAERLIPPTKQVEYYEQRAKGLNPLQALSRVFSTMSADEQDGSTEA